MARRALDQSSGGACDDPMRRVSCLALLAFARVAMRFRLPASACFVFGLSMSVVACGDSGKKATAPDGKTCTCNDAKCGLDNCNESCGSCGAEAYCGDGACTAGEAEG